MSSPAKGRTVKIKLNQGVGGHVCDDKGQVRHAFSHLPGTVIDWPADEAARYVERGIASYADQPAAK